MAKAQELSLNMIVVGSLALLVLLIIGGVMIFGGQDILGGLTGMGPSSEEVSQTTFLSQCRSKCNTLTLTLQSRTNWYNNINSRTDADDLQIINAIKEFCCYSADLDSDGKPEMTGSSGPEFCAKAYSQCSIDGMSALIFCKKMTQSWHYYDFTRDTRDPTDYYLPICLE